MGEESISRSGRGLTDELAEQIIEEKKEMLRSIRIVNKKKIEDILSETRDEYEMYKDIFSMKEEGYSYQQIADKHGIDRSKITYWTERGTLPYLFNLKNYFSRKSMRLDNKRDSLLLMGMRAGRKRSSKDVASDISSRDRKLLESVQRLYFNVFSVVPRMYFASQTWRLNFKMQEFDDYFNLHTKNNSRVPWHLLSNKYNKGHYFAGYFARKGGVYPEWKRTNIILSIYDDNPLKLEFAALLLDLGMVPRSVKKGLRISDPLDVRLVHDKYCLSQVKRKKLEGVAESGLTRERWKEVTRLLDRGVGKEEIIRRGEVGCLSRRIDTYLELQEILKDVGYRHGVAYCYGKLGAGLEAAHELAERFSFKEIQKCSSLEQVYGNIVFPENNKHEVYQKADYLAYRRYVCGEDSESGGRILLEHLFNMYLSSDIVSVPEKRRAFYLNCYRGLRRHPRFAEFVLVDGEDLIVNRTDLAEEILSSAHVGTKIRYLKEATGI